MKNDIKTIIEEKSRELFNARGYSGVSMRDIANACGISVGNLTYHYARKEDLLMCEHDYIMNTFLEEIRTHEQQLAGLEGYITAETAFLHWIAQNEAVLRLYKDVINIPVLRDRYCCAHHRLYLDFVPGADPAHAWKGTAAMCGVEFELADELILSVDFADTMKKLLLVFFLFGEQPAPAAEVLSSCVARGIALSSRFRDLS